MAETSGVPTAPRGKFVPPHLRPGYTGQGTKMSDEPDADGRLQIALERAGWKKGSGGQYYWPADGHPHLHLGKGGGAWFIAYSEGKQHVGGHGIQMVAKSVGKARTLGDYASGVDKLSKAPRANGPTPTANEVKAALAAAMGALDAMP